jgi:hypothetical protein
MTNDRWLVLPLLTSLSLGVGACGSSTTPLDNPSVATETVTLTDSMYSDTVWSVPVGSGPFVSFNARVATIPFSAITPDVAANGLVLVYINTDTLADSAQWTPLPYNISLNYLETFTYAYSAGQVQIAVYTSETNIDVFPPDVYALTLPTTEFKIVVASGSPLADRHLFATAGGGR